MIGVLSVRSTYHLFVDAPADLHRDFLIYSYEGLDVDPCVSTEHGTIYMIVYLRIIPVRS